MNDRYLVSVLGEQVLVFVWREHVIHDGSLNVELECRLDHFAVDTIVLFHAVIK